jgi:ribosomal protein S27AE
MDISRHTSLGSVCGDEIMANTNGSIEWHAGKNHSIGYVRCHSGGRRALYYVQKDAMDWILDRECVRVARGSTMAELQDIAERQEQESKL